MRKNEQSAFFFYLKHYHFYIFFFPRVTIVKLLDGLAVFWILNQIYKLFIF